MKDNIFKMMILILFILFIGLYTIASSDYYNYEASNRNRLTEEQIKVFENDIEQGKDIDIDGYINKNQKKYNNLISDTTSNLSATISKSFDKAINFIFNKMNDLVENN